MLINNYFFLAMDTQQELDRTLQRQDFGSPQNILEKLHVGNSIRALDVARELHLL